MIVYRLSKKKYKDDLTGRGAEKTGGRWNSKGIPVIYTSESRALCMSELAVHIPYGNIPDDYLLIQIEIPDVEKITEIKTKGLPPDWKSFPHSDQVQKVGDKILKQNKYLVIKVPSAVVQGDFNYLINPKHKNIHRVRVIGSERFTFDERLFKKR